MSATSRTDNTGALVGAAGAAGPAALPAVRQASVVARLRRHRGAVIGSAILLLLVLMALLAPLLAPYEPYVMTTERALKPPTAVNWLGTDQFGRDILSRIMHGARLSLMVGFISVGIALLVGVPLGLAAGYYGRWFDATVTMLIDLKLAFPGILLALCIMAILGSNLLNLMVAVGISAVPAYTRLVRGAVLSAKQNVYVEAARVIGVGDVAIMLRHILPNVVAPVIVLATLGLAQAILVASALSFLGLGAKPPTPEWGAMLSEGRNFLQLAPWITAFPGLAIMLAVLSINMLGDGVRDALDPRLK